MPVSCSFVLSRDKPIYYAGEQISGSIRICTTKPVILNAIELSFIGLSEAKWSETLRTQYLQHNDSTEVIRQIYSGKYGHFRDTQLNEHDIELSPDKTFAREFCFKVPLKLPATYRHFYGEVKYMLKLVLNRRKVLFDKTFKQPLVIKACLDLSKLPALNELYFIRSSRKSGVLHDIAFTLARTGFVPGQLLKYNLHVNKIGKCAKILVQLCQHITFHSKLPVQKSRDLKRIIACNKINKRYWEHNKQRNLSIPLAIPITTVNQDVLVCISYHVEVVAMAKNEQILEKLMIPVVIGTVPIPTGEHDYEEETCKPLHCYDNWASTVVQHKRTLSDEQEISSSEETNTIFELVPTQPVEHCDKMALLALREDFRKLA